MMDVGQEWQNQRGREAARIIASFDAYGFLDSRRPTGQGLSKQAARRRCSRQRPSVQTAALFEAL